MKWRNVNPKYNDHLDAIKRLNPYERLDVSPESTLEEVKAAYRRKISLYHPDRTDSFMTTYSQEVVKLLNEALDIIRAEKNK